MTIYGHSFVYYCFAFVNLLFELRIDKSTCVRAYIRTIKTVNVEIDINTTHTKNK